MDDDDDLIIPEEIQPAKNKRPREDDGEEPAAKKTKFALEQAPQAPQAPEAAPVANGVSSHASDAVVIDD